MYVVFEDLIFSPKKEMKKICKFLKINFSADLIVPTDLDHKLMEIILIN